MLALVAWNAAVVAALFVALWAASVWKRDASIVDPFWGLGFVAVAWSTWWQAERPPGIALAIVVLTTVWGLRLSLFLFWRNRGHGEDYRYREMREYHGERFKWVSLGTVFGLQAIILWFVSFPVQWGIAARVETVASRWLELAGVLVWSIGLFFEAVGDWQLARFKRSPDQAGKVLDTGLWRYTRHPNYFGDCCVWWGFYLLACGGGAWLTIASPLVMTLLLLKVSGVALLEKSIGNRRPEYAAYVARTNAFFPGPPRRSTNLGDR